MCPQVNDLTRYMHMVGLCWGWKIRGVSVLLDVPVGAYTLSVVVNVVTIVVDDGGAGS